MARPCLPWLLLAALMTGCGSDSTTPPDAGDGDADADADADGDTDADADGDADVPPPDDLIFDGDVIRTYDLEVDDTDWQWLNENATLEEYVPATVVFEGERYESAAVRYKGGYGALLSCFDVWGNRTCAKLSMKVSFNEYDAAGRFHGLKKLQFHSMNRDASQMRDRLAYALFDQMSVVAPRTAYAKVRVNGEDLGLFVLIEHLDGRFTDRHFDLEGGDGNLYKEVWPLGADPQPYVDALETNEETADVSRMIQFAGDLAAASDEDFLAVLGQWMDLPTLYDFLAVDMGISHWDGIIAWYCNGGVCGNHNYYWYEEAESGRMWLLPWDMDHAFNPSPWETYYGVPSWREQTDNCVPYPIILDVGVRAPVCDSLIDRFGRLAFDGYAASARRLLDGPLQEAAVLARIDELHAQIEDIVVADVNGPGADAFAAGVAELRAAIPTVRASLEADIQ